MTRMVRITQTFLIDVEAKDSLEAERIAQEQLAQGEIDLEDPTVYSVVDCGPGSWDD